MFGSCQVTPLWFHKRTVGPILLAGLLAPGWASWITAQQQSPTDTSSNQPAGAQNSSPGQQPDEEGQAAPTRSPTADTEGTVLTPAREKVSQTRASALLGSFRLQETYDDNLGLVPETQPRAFGTYTFGEARLKFSHQDANTEWLIDGSFGGRYYPHFPSLNTPSYDGRLQLHQWLTRHLGVTLTQRFASTPGGAFEETNPNQQFPVFGSDEETLLLLQRKRISEESSVAFSYRASKRVSATFGGDYGQIRYSAARILRSNSGLAYAMVYFQPSWRQSIGFGFSNLWLYYPGQSGDARVANLLTAYTVRPTRKLSLSAYGGPALIQPIGQSTVPIGSLGFPLVPGAQLQSKWTWLGGASINQSFGRNKIQLQYNRMFSRGSGFLVTAVRQSGTATLSRQVNHRLELSVAGAVSRNNLAEFASVGFRSYHVQPMVRYQFSSRLFFSAWYINAQARGETAFSTLNRNAVVGQFEYNLREIGLRR